MVGTPCESAPVSFGIVGAGGRCLFEIERNIGEDGSNGTVSRYDGVREMMKEAEPKLWTVGL